MLNENKGLINSLRAIGNL